MPRFTEVEVMKTATQEAPSAQVIPNGGEERFYTYEDLHAETGASIPFLMKQVRLGQLKATKFGSLTRFSPKQRADYYALCTAEAEKKSA
jgi:hypothetical protein